MIKHVAGIADIVEDVPAEACLGSADRAAEVPLGLTLGFEVADIEAAAAAVAAGGTDLIQPAKTEPWGQQTARFRLPGGGLGEVSVTPWARDVVTNVEASGD